MLDSSKQPRSKQRFHFIDLARGLAIIFMAMVHVLGEMSSPLVNDSLFGAVVTFLGGPPAAPVFVFLLGTSLILSRKHSAIATAQRGMKLLALAYLLNLVRESIPSSIALYLGVISKNDLASGGLLSTLLVVDILHFAGLALIILSMVRKGFQNPAHYIIVAGIIALSSPFLWGHMTNQPVLDWLLTLLWGTGGEMVAFPIFPWLTYSLLGMAFGHLLLQYSDLRDYLNKAALTGLCCLSLGTLLILNNYSYHVGDYWRSGPGLIIWITGFILLFLFLCQKITTTFVSHHLLDLLYYWSSKVTVFYVIHWILIGWMSFFIYVNSISMTVFLMALILALSHMFTTIYVKSRA